MVSMWAFGRLAHGLPELAHTPTHTYHWIVGVSDVLATQKENGGKWGEMKENGGEKGGNGELCEIAKNTWREM